MNDDKFIRKGTTLFNRLVRMYVDNVGIRTQRLDLERGGVVRIRLVLDGPWLYFMADEFDEALDRMRKRKVDGQ